MQDKEGTKGVLQKSLSGFGPGPPYTCSNRAQGGSSLEGAKSPPEFFVFDTLRVHFATQVFPFKDENEQAVRSVGAIREGVGGLEEPLEFQGMTGGSCRGREAGWQCARLPPAMPPHG